MNKTLLIVICDFLLLSMLGMISFEDIPTKQEKPSDDLLVAPYADSQLVDLLKMSLDKERENRDDLSSKVDEYSSKAKEVEDISKEQAKELAKKQEALDSLEEQKSQALDLAESERLAKEELALDKQKAIAQAEDLQARLQSEVLAKEFLENDKTQALAKAQSLEDKLQDESLVKQELEEKLGQFSESDALLKARLEAMQRELELAKADAENLQKENAKIQEQTKALSTQLEVEKTKASIYQEDLQRTQSLVWQEKTEKQQIQEHAQSLAKGVDKLSDSQEKLLKTVEEARPLSASEIYENYKENALNIDISYKRNSLFGNGEKKETVKAVILDLDGEYLALFSPQNSIFESYLSVNTKATKIFPPENLKITPWAKGLKFDLPSLYYLKGYGRILAFKIPSAFIEKSKLKTFKTAQNPFKHSEAIVIDTQKLYYGQLRYNVDEKSSAIANVDSSFFSSIFGDFSPSAGDLVFDRSGDFLGLMWTSSSIVLPKSFNLSAPLALSSKYNREAASTFLTNMRTAK